jgi:hypothetical protein
VSGSGAGAAGSGVLTGVAETPADDAADGTEDLADVLADADRDEPVDRDVPEERVVSDDPPGSGDGVGLGGLTGTRPGVEARGSLQHRPVGRAAGGDRADQRGPPSGQAQHQQPGLPGRVVQRPTYLG